MAQSAQPSIAPQSDKVAPSATAPSAAMAGLSPELIEALSRGVSGSDADLAASVATLRRDSKKHATLLRKALATMPDAHPGRGSLLYLLGEIGDDDDVPSLELLAASPVVPNTSTTTHDENEAQSDNWPLLSLYALSAISRRNIVAATRAMKRLLGTADKSVAVCSAVELYELGQLEQQDIDVLRGRGIPFKPKKLSFEDTFRIDPSQLHPAPGKSSKPMVRPPVFTPPRKGGN